MRNSRWSLPLVMLVLLATPYRTVAQSVDELFRQGNEAQASGRFSDAEGIWRRVLQSDSDNAVAYNNLGNALRRQGKLEEAIAAFRQAIQLDPKNAFPYNGLGNALADQGKPSNPVGSQNTFLKKPSMLSYRSLERSQAFPYRVYCPILRHEPGAIALMVMTIFLSVC
jgi:tetratricopeptide (TPR) repeat protein